MRNLMAHLRVIAVESISPRSLLVLTYLGLKREPQRMCDLAQVAKVTTAGMTDIIDRLVTLQLVERTDGDDRRVVMISITPKATDLLQKVMSKVSLERGEGVD